MQAYLIITGGHGVPFSRVGFLAKKIDSDPWEGRLGLAELSGVLFTPTALSFTTLEAGKIGNYQLEVVPDHPFLYRQARFEVITRGTGTDRVFWWSRSDGNITLYLIPVEPAFIERFFSELTAPTEPPNRSDQTADIPW